METFVSSCRPLQWAKHKERGYLSDYGDLALNIELQIEKTTIVNARQSVLD